MRLVEQRELASQQTNSAFLSWHFLDLEDHHSTCYLVEDPSSLLAEGEQDSSMRETAGGPRIIPPAPSGERPTRLPERPDSVSLAVPRLQEVLNSRIEGRPPLVLDSREIRQIQHEEINEEVVARQVFELFPADMHTEAYRDYANEIAAQVMAGLREMSLAQVREMFEGESAAGVIRGAAPFAYVAQVTEEQLNANIPDEAERYRGEIRDRLDRERPRIVDSVIEGLREARRIGERR